MYVEEQLQNTIGSLNKSISPGELQFMAFSGQYEQVYSLFRRIPTESRSRYADKHILNQVVWGGIIKLRKFLAVHAEAPAEEEKAFISDVVEFFIHSCNSSGIFPREVFETILYWSDELVQLVLHDEAEILIRQALKMGCNKFPGLQLQFLSRLASIAKDKGDLQRAYAILADIAGRPYLITERRQIPEILFELALTTLKIGDVAFYKKILFLGLRYFYTDTEDRRIFVDQIRKTYRRFYRVFLEKKYHWPDKALFLVHWLYFKLPDFSQIKLGFLNKILQFGVLGYVYSINYFRKDTDSSLLVSPEFQDKVVPINGSFKKRSAPIKRRLKSRKHFLITRAMGGIGDFLMMTPGIHALKRKHPDREILLAIPRRYFPVFEANPDVTLFDVEDTNIHHTKFRKWFNFSDCPASRAEALTAPRVKKNRIELFARALGISGIAGLRMDVRPRYFLTKEDKVFAEGFWRNNQLSGNTVIGVQLHADESYRDYPHMEALVKELSKTNTVLLFDAQPITGYEFNNVIKVDNLSIREAFALGSRCDLIIAPDSAFMHLAGALQIPCIALFGPIDGYIRTKDYPTVEYLDASDRLGCVSCWRNEATPCKLTEMRRSVCMGDIKIHKILNSTERVLKGQQHETLEQSV